MELGFGEETLVSTSMRSSRSSEVGERAAGVHSTFKIPILHSATGPPAGIMVYKTFFFAVACVAVLHGASGYSKGAPKDTCEDMVPQHPVAPQPINTSPYLIKLSKNKIRAGEKVDVTVTGKKGETIKGFLLQARVGNTPVGQFSSSKDVQTIDCGSGKQNAATHTNAEVKKEIKVTWTAPPNLKETVNIYATVAKDGGTFWVAQKSPRIVVS